ncbi:MAG: hypothetical protein IMZ52_01160 [Actinobacteria bacterium]|nr:hypothetical protein [Actinomycetota bacterium]MBE3114747.1 hypothetical protein [Actinomycetota bacterium]
MNDDWSLKDKKWMIDGELLYPEKYIETLRKKLIEDIEKDGNYTDGQYNDWIETPKKNVVEIINKRFGYE